MSDLQKASMWKRISAFLFDIILIVMVAVGFAFLLSLILKYDSHSDTYYEHYKTIEQKYGITFDVTEDEYKNYDDETKQKYDDAYAELLADKVAMKEYNMTVNLMLIITSTSILLSFVVFEFIIPIILKNGMTIGKKVFGLGVMKTNSVKINNISLFVRTILGKYTIETMIPVLLVIGWIFNTVSLPTVLIVIGLMGVLQIIVMIATKTNSTIHDILAYTVVVDFQSQRIFDTEEEIIKFKEEEHMKKIDAPTFKKTF